MQRRRQSWSIVLPIALLLRSITLQNTLMATFRWMWTPLLAWANPPTNWKVPFVIASVYLSSLANSSPTDTFRFLMVNSIFRSPWSTPPERTPRPNHPTFPLGLLLLSIPLLSLTSHPSARFLATRLNEALFRPRRTRITFFFYFLFFPSYLYPWCPFMWLADAPSLG